MKSAATGGHDAWPSDKYLNLWVCHLNGAGLLGYAQFPGGPAATDGVVINHTAFGTIGTAAAPFNLGRTATHEIGHFFNLHHIWGDVTNCTGTDLVGDTPNQADHNFGTPTFPHVTCSNGPNGDMFMNYMDYTDDVAMFMFTAGQVTRMQAALDGPRASLGSPKALPTLKFRDDITLKFSDDGGGTLKVLDDPLPTLKFRDDITLKFSDDGGGSLKFTEDPVGTGAGGDPIGPGPINPGGPVSGPGLRGASPFILSTPHHSMAWAGSFPQAYQAQIAAHEQQIQQLAQLLSQYHEGEQAGVLTDVDRQQAEQVYQEYERLMAEYQRMVQGG